MENNISNSLVSEAMLQNSPAIQYRQENKFKPDISDFLFALVAFVLGYVFSSWVLFVWQGWGVAAFTTAYLASVTMYLIRKGAFIICHETWFWLFVTWATGLSYSLWENAGFAGIRAMFLFCAAVYYVISASGNMLRGKTGNFFILDGLNAVMIIPFRNIFNQYVSFSALRKGEKRGRGLSVFLGVIIALILSAILIPMLRRADSGGFSVILDFFADLFAFQIAEFIIYAVFAVPIAAFLYGLASGVAHKKGTDLITLGSAEKTVAALRILQPTTVFIAFGTICALYLVFILSQTPYFFSAFTGNRPEGWLIYSEYARRGFFELCGIAAINLVVLTISNVTCKKQRIYSRMLKAFNTMLALITLVLIATALSKMALYIDAYGLTMPRLLPCVFMIFMAVVFIALIALQKWDFSIVRFALITGSVLLCALCLSNPDALVVRYNSDRYLSGTLQQYDMEILYRSGNAGILPALEVCENTTDEGLREELSIYFMSRQWRASAGGHKRSLESYKAWEGLGQLTIIN